LYSPFTDDFLPYLAESYYWINDYTLEVKIKDKATWWDNSAITAYDINYTLWLRKKI